MELLMSEQTASALGMPPLSEQSDYVSRLERQHARSQREIVELSRLLIETSLAQKHALVEVTCH